MAIVNYLIQGLEETQNHFSKLQEILTFDEATNIIMTTAYLKYSAVELLENELKKNRDKLVILVGIRNGVTSMQSLKKLYQTGVKVYVVDTGSTNIIFHMKNYVCFNDKIAVAITGSANFTPSGLLRNIEGSSIIELDLNNDNDKYYLDTFVGNINSLIKDYPDNVIRIYDESYIDKLFLEGLIADEEKESLVKNIGQNNKNENVVPKMKLKIQKCSLKTLRRITRKAIPVDEKIKEETASYMTKDKSFDIIEIWKSKELKERDLNVPSNKSSTNVTGSMLLKKGQYDVDQQTYFRDVAFNHLDWKNKDGKPSYFEYATAKIKFIIEGVEFGTKQLEIKHDSRTDTATYKQKQPMTHLLWGEAKSLISNRNLLNKKLTLYKIVDSDNEYIINID